jgi:hypothetical protein
MKKEKVEMIALVATYYGGKTIVPNQHYFVEPQYVHILTATKRAKLAEEKPKGRYARRDMRAED